MKSYRCVFSYSGGNTSIDIAAPDGDRAIEAAAAAIAAGDYDRVEVWDGDNLVIERTTPRAWDVLGDASEAVDRGDHDQRQPAPLPPGLPRRPSSALVPGPRTIGLGGPKVRRRRAGG